MENLLFLCVPKFGANYSRIIMCRNIGTPTNHHFPFGTSEKVVVLGVLKHLRVLHFRIIMVIILGISFSNFLPYHLSDLMMMWSSR